MSEKEKKDLPQQEEVHTEPTAEAAEATQAEETFTVTREQMAMFFYTYSEKNGMDVTGRTDISGFADYDRVHGYALEAMSWAVNVGIISGTSDTTLSPRDSATRAQVATIIMSYVENVVKASVDNSDSTVRPGESTDVEVEETPAE